MEPENFYIFSSICRRPILFKNVTMMYRCILNDRDSTFEKNFENVGQP
jgi:hypothetical protein